MDIASTLLLSLIFSFWFFGLGYAIGIYKQTLKDIKILNENATILKYFKEKYEKALPKSKGIHALTNPTNIKNQFHPEEDARWLGQDLLATLNKKPSDENLKKVFAFVRKL